METTPSYKRKSTEGAASWRGHLEEAEAFVSAAADKKHFLRGAAGPFSLAALASSVGGREVRRTLTAQTQPDGMQQQQPLTVPAAVVALR